MNLLIIALSVSIGAWPVISKDTNKRGLINSSKNQLGFTPNVLIEFKDVTSLASVGNLAKTNFLKVPSESLIELSPPLKFVIVWILLSNLSIEFFKKPKLGIEL